MNHNAINTRIFIAFTWLVVQHDDYCCSFHKHHFYLQLNNKGSITQFWLFCQDSLIKLHNLLFTQHVVFVWWTPTHSLVTFDCNIIVSTMKSPYIISRIILIALDMFRNYQCNVLPHHLFCSLKHDIIRDLGISKAMVLHFEAHWWFPWF